MNVYSGKKMNWWLLYVKNRLDQQTSWAGDIVVILTWLNTTYQQIWWMTLVWEREYLWINICRIIARWDESLICWSWSMAVQHDHSIRRNAEKELPNERRCTCRRNYTDRHAHQMKRPSLKFCWWVWRLRSATETKFGYQFIISVQLGGKTGEIQLHQNRCWRWVGVVKATK